MKNSISKMIAVFCTAAVMVACTKNELKKESALQESPAASSEMGKVVTISTAQSQMIYLNLAGGGNSNTFFIQGTTTWSFDDDECAGTPATRLVNTTTTFTSSSCSGGGSNSGQPCNSTNAPAPPTPTHAEIIAALTSGGGANWSNAEKATFFCGGTITRTGTLQLTRTGLSGSGNWKFNYDVSASLAIAAGSCWTSVTSTNGTNVNYNGFAAGESVQIRSSGSWTSKYSFSMSTGTDANGLPISRCQNVTAYLERMTGGTLNDNPIWSVVTSQPVDASEISTTSVVNGTSTPYDVLYFGNAGSAGSGGALTWLHTKDRKPAALVSEIVGSDDFPGNDNDLAERALLIGAGFNIAGEPGTYRVRVVGTIKGNTGTVNAGFNVSKSFNVIGDPSCAISK